MADPYDDEGAGCCGCIGLVLAFLVAIFVVKVLWALFLFAWYWTP